MAKLNIKFSQKLQNPLIYIDLLCIIIGVNSKNKYNFNKISFLK